MSAVRKLCCLLWALSFSVFGVYAEDNVLWWMFDETTSIDDVNGGAAVTIGDLVGRGDAAGKTVNAIRIAAYSGDSLLGYLAMPLDGDLDDNTFYNMPSLEGTSEPYAETWNAGPAYAELGTYATTPGTSFVIELGNWDYEDTNPDTRWTVLAVSEPGTVDSLEKFIHDSNYDMQSKLEWTGGHYSVPEPTSGLLVLVGGALLALRRRRMRVDEVGSGVN